MPNNSAETRKEIVRFAAATVVCLMIAVLSVPLFARTDEAPQPTIIRAGKFFDSEKGAFLKDQYITISNKRIAAVGPGPVSDKNAKVIDLSRYTVLPGLVDCHTHLLFLEAISPQAGLSTESLKSLIIEGDALRALRGAARARTFLEAGITTVQDLGNSGQYADVALRRAIEEGSVAGCRMRVSGPGAGRFRASSSSISLWLPMNTGWCVAPTMPSPP